MMIKVLFYFLNLNYFDWAGFSRINICSVFIISNNGGIKALVVFSFNQSAFAIFCRHAPPVVCYFDAIIAANTFVSLMNYSNHSASITLYNLSDARIISSIGVEKLTPFSTFSTDWLSTLNSLMVVSITPEDGPVINTLSPTFNE